MVWNLDQTINRGSFNTEAIAARASFLRGKEIFISIDDTSKGRRQKHFAAVVVGVLGPKMERLPISIEKINAKTGLVLYNSVKSALVTIFGDLGQARLRLLVTDSARPMRTCGNLLRKDFPQMKHMFCVVHKVHLAMKVLQKLNPVANLFIGQVKQILSRSSARNDFFKKFTGGNNTIQI